jgi:hypothetical protein
MILKVRRKVIVGLGFFLIACAAAAFGLAPGAAAKKRASSFDSLKKRDIERMMRYQALASRPGRTPSESVRLFSAASLPTDKDDDGMSDSWERANGFSPSNPNDAWLDPDKDNVVNLFEYQLGSDPKSASSPPVVTVGTSSAADYTSLADALDSCESGSVIRVAKGTYKVNYMTFDPKTVMIQGGWSKDFLKRDLKLYPVTLDGANKDEVLYFSYSSGTNGIILDGLKIVRGKGDFGAVNFLAQNSAFMKVSIFNCFILQSGSTYALGSVLGFNNWIDSLSDRTVANTVIAGNTASGIKAQVTGSTKARWRIINSAIYGNKNGSGDNGYGIDSFTFADGVLNAHIFNSILWGNAQEDINLWGSIGFNVDHSDLDKALAGYGATCKIGTGRLNVNPGFVAPGSFNYHLSSSSPLINVGINKGIPLIDFEGEKRVKGAAPDIGPDER